MESSEIAAVPARAKLTPKAPAASRACGLASLTMADDLSWGRAASDMAGLVDGHRDRASRLRRCGQRDRASSDCEWYRRGGEGSRPGSAQSRAREILNAGILCGCGPESCTDSRNSPSSNPVAALSNLRGVAHERGPRFSRARFEYRSFYVPSRPLRT